MGADLTKTVNLVNKSKKAVDFWLTEANNDFSKLFLSNFPPNDKEWSLKPKEILPIEIRFKPLERLAGFRRDLMLQIKGSETRKLLSIMGVCHWIELKLMNEVLGFIPVVVNS